MKKVHFVVQFCSGEVSAKFIAGRRDGEPQRSQLYKIFRLFTQLRNANPSIVPGSHECEVLIYTTIGFFRRAKTRRRTRPFAPTVRLAYMRIHARTTSCVQIQFGIELHGRMITDVNNSVIMTSTVAGYANKPWRGEIKDVEPAEKEEGEENEMQTGASPVVKYEKIKRRTGYDGDPHIVMIEKIRTPLGRRTKGGKQEGREEG